MKTRGFILRRIMILLLAFTVLNLLQGCMTYNFPLRDKDSGSLYRQYIRQGKYLVLVSPEGKCHLADPKITGSVLCGTVAPIDEDYLVYIYSDQENSPIPQIKKREITLEKLVFVFTSLSVPDSTTNVVIPFDNIDQVRVYKWQMTTGTKSAILVVILTGFLLAISGGDVGYVIEVLLSFI